jgi:hypothetical protein
MTDTARLGRMLLRFIPFWPGFRRFDRPLRADRVFQVAVGLSLVVWISNLALTFALTQPGWWTTVGVLLIVPYWTFNFVGGLGILGREVVRGFREDDGQSSAGAVLLSPADQDR